jgi:cyclopropane fatty-acyl-phospholipid synthase-like methyltransferase
MNLKGIIRGMPIIGPLSRAIKPPKPSAPSFTTSGEYWESRYASGGNSGAGSYNRLAQFKAEFLNEFVECHEINSVIEFGCGDGAQLEYAKYPNYIGVDVSETILHDVRKRYAENNQYYFMHVSEVSSETKADLSLSLDVIYHLVENNVFDIYMHQLFNASEQFVIIYSSNEDKEWTSPHVHHRLFQTWIEMLRPDFMFLNHTPNRYPFDPKDQDNTSFSDFYVYRRVNL